MKKINKKLIILISIISILIVLSIISILNVNKENKENKLINSVETAAIWIDSQYQKAKTGKEIVASFTALYESDGNSNGMPDIIEENGVTTVNKDLILSTGLDVENVKDINIYINPQTGKSCITININPDGEYKNLDNGYTIQGGICS